MAREESLYPLDWFRIAEKDLRRAEHLLNIEDAEAAGFFLQQALEKPQSISSCEWVGTQTDSSCGSVAERCP